MSRAWPARFASALLFRMAEVFAPTKTRGWIAAIRAESRAIPDPLAQLHWAAGALFTALRANVIDDHGRSILLAVIFGISAAYIDLHTATRIPLQIILIACGLLIALFGASRAMLALPALLASRALLVVCLGFPPPYSIDRMDVFYSVVPIAIGACAGLAGRAAFLRLRNRA
jgi:hypothetical protein